MKIFYPLMTCLMTLGFLQLFAGCASTSTLKVDPKKPIELNNGFRQDGKLVDYRDVDAKLKENPASAETIGEANTFQTLSVLLSTPGGALIGYPIGTALGHGTPNWTLAYVGAGLTVAGLALSFVAQSKLTEALEKYNRSLSKAKQGSDASATELVPYVAFTDSSGLLGLQLRF